MKFLLTLCFFFVLGNAVAQEYTITINISDAITQQPANIISAIGIKQGQKGTIEMEAESKGKYVLHLEEGKYAFEFKHQNSKTMNVIINVSKDEVHNLVFQANP